MIVFQGIQLFTDFKPGAGSVVGSLPTTPGIYAEIYWPQRGLRFGETGRILRNTQTYQPLTAAEVIARNRA